MDQDALGLGRTLSNVEQHFASNNMRGDPVMYTHHTTRSIKKQMVSILFEIEMRFVW